MLCDLFLLLLSLNSIKALQKIQNIDEKTNELLECAKAIAQRHFLQAQNVEIISQDRIYGFEDFGIVIRTTSGFQYPDFRTGLTKYGIIFLKSNNNYQEDLQTLSALRWSDPQGRFIISIKNKKTDTSRSWEEYLKKITFYLASIERWNVIILTNDAGSSKIRVYTYTMYSFGNCSRREPELLDHGNCDDVGILKNLYPAFINFQKCPIHLSTREFPPFSITYKINGEKQIRGIESNLVKLIIEKFNATYKVFEEANGAAIRNSVKTRKADLAWACLLQYQYDGTVWSQSYLLNKVLIVIPQSRLMPLWLNLILPFQTEVWVGLVTLICVHISVKVLIPSIRKEFHVEWMLSGFFGIGILKLPRRLSHRLYLLSWTIFGYIVMQSYSASLTGFFASPGQYKQMQTLNELEESKIVTGGLENMKSQLALTNPGLSRNLKVFSEAEYFGNVAKLASRTGGIASYVREDGIPNITRGQESNFIVIPEPINVYPLAMLLPNSSLILVGCNRVIQHVCDAGLVRFWQEQFIREMNSGFESNDENSTQKTSFTHLEAAFFILGIGYCIGGIIFAVELILAKFRKYFSKNASL